VLQKIYWLGQVQSDYIKTSQEFRTLFCKHEFPTYNPFLSPAFAIASGGTISTTCSWVLVINNCSFIALGSVVTPVDEISEQIRRLLILKLNFFFGKSPDEVEKYCNSQHSVGSELVPKQILPDVFSDTSRMLHNEMEDLDPWFQKVLSIDRSIYKTLCKALAAYERALHVLSSDPSLSYSLLVFVIEALANSDLEYQATWDNVPGPTRNRFDTLFDDERLASVDVTWTNELRQVLVDVLHPGATRRFTEFMLKHIPLNLHDASHNSSKFPLRRSRIRDSIQNAYDLRSSFSHALEPLTQFLVYESHRAEEIEQNGQSYLTLRGMFLLVRSVVLEFIEQHESVDSCSYPWHNEPTHGVSYSRSPAHTRIKGSTEQLHTIESQYAQAWFEDILEIYQDNYVEQLHKKMSDGQANADWLIGIATSGPFAGRMLFRFDPSPSYDWPSLREQSLRLIPQAPKDKKGYLQAIALLCAHLEKLDGGNCRWDDALGSRTFGDTLSNLERFIVDVIHGATQNWSGQQAETLLERYLKKRKVLLPTRVEIACMLEVAKLFQQEGLIEERRKWLEHVYGDTALYPQFQTVVQNALASDDVVVEPQEILNTIDSSPPTLPAE
jgi:hypothetical protein